MSDPKWVRFVENWLTYDRWMAESFLSKVDQYAEFAAAVEAQTRPTLTEEERTILVFCRVMAERAKTTPQLQVRRLLAILDRLTKGAPE